MLSITAFETMIRIVYLFLALASANIWAQQMPRTQLKGKVFAEIAALDGIYVINQKTEKTSITNQEGEFTTFATVGDTLVFSSTQFREMRIALTSKDFEDKLVTVKMNAVINQLDEVIVSNRINSVSMGIIPKGQRSYTPAERRLSTATNLNASANVGTMMGGSISADPLLNWISGRTKMLKKELEVEKKESYLRQLENMFDANFYVNKLKIPSEYVKGFEYYAVENESFVTILKSKNVATITFLISELAIKYKEIIACEN